ncbi:MAG: magnesium-translocating P-type ATPase [Rhizobiaceae bacterium]
MVQAVQDAYWSAEAGTLFVTLQSGARGLTAAEAARRLNADGPNVMQHGAVPGPLRLLLRQFESPLVLVLVFGAILSLVLRQWADSAIVLIIVLASALFSFQQEYRASSALADLRKRLALKSKVIRGGTTVTVSAAAIVPGDVLQLSAGALIAADGVVLKASDFLVTEATLTGESMPVEKRPGLAPAAASLSQRLNCVFAGTSVRSGFADVLVVRTRKETELGKVEQSMEGAEPETGFERGVRQFGNLLIRIMIILVLAVLATSYAMGRPVIESLLFAVALAVGMTPELLPAIITVTLSKGASAMAADGVIVRRLSALENLGGMDILCTDKTGTLTEGTVKLADAVDLDAKPSGEVLRLGYLNAAFETGIENPLDTAICEAGKAADLSLKDYVKVDEIPFDFVRKRLTIVVADKASAKTNLIVTKGSFKAVVDVCSDYQGAVGVLSLDAAARKKFSDLLDAKGVEGFRVLALATKQSEPQPDYTLEHERGMTLAGLLLFADPPKSDAAKAVADLASLGVKLKIITGDNREVASHVAKAIGVHAHIALSGPEIALMKDEALSHKAERAGLFYEIDPQQKERIILALQKRGHSVGYMGDGINDAPALHAADVGISVDQAVDVARQSADIVLLKRDLGVLRTGIESGRRTFANTRKYIAITTSANFGNMVSMAIATPFLPFLPLLAKQILLNNFLSDIPSVAISTDNVDPEVTKGAEQWDIAGLKRYMVVFGLVSSVFDLLAFALLLRFFSAGEAEFQTAWFVVSLLTETSVVLVQRTTRPVYSSRPGRGLLVLSITISILAVILPYISPVARLFGFVPLPTSVTMALIGLAFSYVVTTEIAKYAFRSFEALGLRRRTRG